MSFLLLVVLSGCGAGEADPAEQEQQPLEEQGGACFNVEYPWASGSQGAGSPMDVYLYVDNSQIPGCASDFSGECSVSVDGTDIQIDSAIAASGYEADSDAECQSNTRASIHCGEITLDAGLHQVHVGEESFEFEVASEDDQVAGGPLGPEWAECVGVAEETVEGNPGRVCVESIESDGEGGTSTVAVSTVSGVGATSCVHGYELGCEVAEQGGGYAVEATASYREFSAESVGETCTADLRELTANCGELELGEGTHAIDFGGETLEFELPLENEEICTSTSQ